MEPLEQLRAKIAGFPGYDGEIERRHSDEYVRSYLGEALAELAERDKLTPDLRGRIDELLLRVAFADPRAFSVHHTGVVKSGATGGEVAEADVATIELADHAASVDAASAATYLDEIAVVLDGREAAIRAASLKMM